MKVFNCAEVSQIYQVPVRSGSYGMEVYVVVDSNAPAMEWRQLRARGCSTSNIYVPRDATSIDKIKTTVHIYLRSWQSLSSPFKCENSACFLTAASISADHLPTSLALPQSMRVGSLAALSHRMLPGWISVWRMPYVSL